MEWGVVPDDSGNRLAWVEDTVKRYALDTCSNARRLELLRRTVTDNGICKRTARCLPNFLSPANGLRTVLSLR